MGPDDEADGVYSDQIGGHRGSAHDSRGPGDEIEWAEVDTNIALLVKPG